MAISVGFKLFPIFAVRTVPRTCQLCHRWSPATFFGTSAKDIELPKPPKRPATSFLLFASEQRRLLAEQREYRNQKNFAIESGALWRSMSDSEKQPYIEKYKLQCEEYKKVSEAYIASLTPEQKKQVANIKTKARKLKKNKTKKKLAKSLGKPRRPKNSFIIYKDEVWASLTSGISIPTEKIKAIGEKWNMLDESAKEQYRVRAAEDLKQYLVKMEEWETAMIEQGHRNLIRLKNQPKPKRRRRSKKAARTLKTMTSTKIKRTKSKTSKKQNKASKKDSSGSSADVTEE